MTLPLQSFDTPLMAMAANYGFAAVMAVMFWRYITNHANEHTQALQSIEGTLKRVEKQLDRLEENHRDK